MSSTKNVISRILDIFTGYSIYTAIFVTYLEDKIPVPTINP